MFCQVLFIFTDFDDYLLFADDNLIHRLDLRYQSPLRSQTIYSGLSITVGVDYLYRYITIIIIYILYVSIIILILHLCVRESGRSREAIRPELKNISFSSSLDLDDT